MTESEETWVCIGCGEEKTNAEFGPAAWCLECDAIRWPPIVRDTFIVFVLMAPAVALYLWLS